MLDFTAGWTDVGSTPAREFFHKVFDKHFFDPITPALNPTHPMSTRNLITLDRIFVTSRTDVIGGETTPLKIARPDSFKTKNAKGRSAIVKDYEAIRELGLADAKHFLSLKKA